jgi:hypothetical protein
MTSTFEQHNTFTQARSRVFYMDASIFGVPFAALHVYRGPSATMWVRVLGVKDVVDAGGPEMDRSETVPLFNDLLLWAPGAVLDAGITWEPLDEARVRATFANAGHAVSAVLTFEDGDLVGFVSEDRLQRADERSFRSLPWSTPIRSHGVFDGVRLPTEASAVWLDPGGDLEYARFTVKAITTF